MCKYRDIILSYMEKYPYDRELVVEDALFFGRSPHIAPKAVTHTLFRRLDNAEILQLESVLGRNLPRDLKEFYMQCNGFLCFVSTLEVSGLRRRYGRDVKTALSQPFDLSIPNVDERPISAEEDMVFFGSYEYDGSCVYTRDDNRIYYAAPDDVKPLKEWGSLEDFLASEFERIFSLFSEKGELLVTEELTLPI